MDMQTIWLVIFLLASYAAVALAVYLALREQPRRRERQEIAERLEQVKRDLHAWECWRCHLTFESESQTRPRPLCLCNECLDAYLQEVA